MILMKKIPGPIYINDLWISNDINKWNEALRRYYFTLSDKEHNLDKELENVKIDDIRLMNSEEFYSFLANKYFIWKYSNNYLNGKLESLKTYIQDDNLEELLSIKDKIFKANLMDIKQCLALAVSIHGLGVAGASGLLAILFPNFFGTVDVNVIDALKEIKAFQHRDFLNKIKNPNNISLDEGTTLIQILREKADELNNLFQPCTKEEMWTPRKIDMILWNIKRGISSFDR